MSAFLTDDARIELALPGHLLARICHELAACYAVAMPTMRVDADKAECLRRHDLCLALKDEAVTSCREAFSGLHVGKVKKLDSRLIRASKLVLDEKEEGRLCVWSLHLLRAMVQILIDQNGLELNDSFRSAYDKLSDLLIPVIEPDKPIDAEKVSRGGANIRKCLCCGRDFPSHGPGNRICPSCKTTEAFRGMSGTDCHLSL